MYKNVNAKQFAAEAKKVMQQLLKDHEAMPKVVIQAPVVAQAPPEVHPAPMASVRPLIQASSSIPQVQPMDDLVPPIVPPVFNGATNFTWDPECCAQNITLSDGNTACYLMEGGYCFRTVVGTVPMMNGISYWEIHADSRTENELKIGVVAKKAFNLNTAFCDYEYGWGYYGLGQLRHGNNSAGAKYGKAFKNMGVLGVCLDMVKGQLSFALNGEYMGVAFKEEALKKGPIYSAVSLLHKAGCKLVCGKPLPPYFAH